MNHRLSMRDLKAMTEKPKANKYGAKKVVIDGHTFDSKKESRRYLTLRELERAGVISGLELQPVFPFIINGRQLVMRSKGYPNGRAIKYVADFLYLDSDGRVVEDVKSRITSINPLYRLKKAIVEHIYNITIREV